MDSFLNIFHQLHAILLNLNFVFLELFHLGLFHLIACCGHSKHGLRAVPCATANTVCVSQGSLHFQCNMLINTKMALTLTTGAFKTQVHIYLLSQVFTRLRHKWKWDPVRGGLMMPSVVHRGRFANSTLTKDAHTITRLVCQTRRLLSWLRNANSQLLPQMEGR